MVYFQSIENWKYSFPNKLYYHFHYKKIKEGREGWHLGGWGRSIALAQWFKTNLGNVATKSHLKKMKKEKLGWRLYIDDQKIKKQAHH
jgi:hypothetical protein